jgi:hypothetical protein
MTPTLAPRVLWTASAAAAIGVGLLTVAMVDADASPGTSPAAATSTQPSSPSTQPSDSSTGADDSSAPSGSTAPTPVPSDWASAEHVTGAGTVWATCTGGALSLAGTPAPGWWLDDSLDPGEVEFENGTQKLEVEISCVGGTPQFFVEGPRDDSSGRGRGGDDPPSSTAPAAPAGGAGYDDSDGRVGGGHGWDDGPGDDSAGRVGGGHGSDDDGDDSGRGRGRGGDD